MIIEHPPNHIYLNDSFDDIEPRELLDHLKINKTRLLREMLETHKTMQKESPSASGFSIDIHGYGVSYRIGCFHGKRVLHGLDMDEELYLLYLEDSWLEEEEARAKYGKRSDPVAEIVLNRYSDEDYKEAVKKGTIKISSKHKKEAQERNKHNLDENYRSESYTKLEEKIKLLEKK
ncbi:MAG TPA: hypothetical protein VIT68_02575 [Candidatus Gracilibacteria bacterium]